MPAIASFDNLAREFEALTADLQDTAAVLADLEHIREGLDALMAANESLHEELRRTETALLAAEQARESEWQGLARQITSTLEEQAASQEKHEASFAESLLRVEQAQAAVVEWHSHGEARLAESLLRLEQAEAAVAEWRSRTEANLVGQADALRQTIENRHSDWEEECRALAGSLRSAVEDAQRAGAEQVQWLKKAAAEWQGRAEAAVGQKMTEQERSLSAQFARLEQDQVAKIEDLQQAYNVAAGRQLAHEAKMQEDFAVVRSQVVEANSETVGLVDSVRSEQRASELKIEREASRLQAELDRYLARLGKVNALLGDLTEHQEQMAEEASQFQENHSEALARREQQLATLARSVDSLTRMRYVFIGAGVWLVILTVLTLSAWFR